MRDQAHREKSGQTAFSFPTVQRIGKGFGHKISGVIRAALLREQNLLVAGSPHPLRGPQDVLKVVWENEGQVQQREQKLN